MRFRLALLAVVTALLALAAYARPPALTRSRVWGGAVAESAVSAGRMQRPSSGAAVVGIDWPEGGAYGTLALLWEAGKETDYADNDPVATPTQFGSVTSADPTQGGADTLKAHYQSPCDVGPGIPCFYFDGGDWYADSAPDANLAFLHDGDGMACYFVVEYVDATVDNSTIISTTDTIGANPGFFTSYVTSADYPRVNMHNGTATLFPTSVWNEYGHTRTAAWAVTVATSRTNDAKGYYRGAVSATTGVDGNLTGTPSSGAPTQALVISRRTTVSTSWNLTGYLFAAACYDVAGGHSDATASSVLDAVEDVTGVLPQ